VAKVPYSKLVPGMVLSRPVVNKNGLVMLAEGTELTQALIDKIIQMDVAGADIKGYSQPAVPQEEMLAQLEARFKNVLDEPHMSEIKELMREHIVGLYG
jgi:hypothetical protein